MRRLRFFALLIALLSLLPTPAHAATRRVGLQVGHWQSAALPDELARLRGSTGSSGGGYREPDVARVIAERAAVYLQQAGVTVDILPATVPVGYQADAFVALHTDGSASASTSGFKIATHWSEWEAGVALVDQLRAAYGPATGLRWDAEHISSGMRGYYAFASGRFDHAIAPTTPGAILELGYLTSPSDRRLLIQQPDRLAQAVAQGLLRFLAARPAAGWPAPPALPEFRATITATIANIRSGPGAQYSVVRTIPQGRVLMIAEVRGDWLRLLSRREGSPRWLHRSTVALTRLGDEPAESP